LGKHSTQERWERVVRAREQARKELGAQAKPGLGEGPVPKKSLKRILRDPPAAVPRLDKSVAVLSLGEAAARLGLTRSEVERMIAAGKIKVVPTAYARMVPASEVDRLARLWGPMLSS
jgi:excisionase family DNA binding protein